MQLQYVENNTVRTIKVDDNLTRKIKESTNYVVN